MIFKKIFYALCTRHPERSEGILLYEGEFCFTRSSPRGWLVSFVLKQKAPKVQERTMLPPHRAKQLARRSFIPPRGYCSSFNINFHLSKLDRVLRWSLVGFMNVHPQTAAYRPLILCFGMTLELTPCPMPRKALNPTIILRHASSKGVLRTQTFNNRSALTGAAITDLANSLYS